VVRVLAVVELEESRAELFSAAGTFRYSLRYASSHLTVRHGGSTSAIHADLNAQGFEGRIKSILVNGGS
jgi:hypothetical protein